MARYTIEELFQLRPAETQPVSFDAAEFKAIVDKVKQVLALKEEEYNAHPHFSGRRSSHHHGKPKIKHNKPKVTTDSDGWSTFEAPKKTTENEDDVAVAGETANEPKESSPAAQETIRVKPNNKNISSSRPADNKDIIADKQVHSFNAFAALESEDDDE